MRRITYVGLLAIAVFIVCPRVAAAEDPPDLAAYVEEIRGLGMSEVSQNSLGAVSELRRRQAILEYRKDEQSGRYWPAYLSTTCPLPDADPSEVAEWAEGLASERRADLLALQRFADLDGSGFVTTEEGDAFRSLVEFGYLASQLSANESVTVEMLAAASGKAADEAQTRLREYLALVGRLHTAGLDGLPSVAGIE